MRFPNNPISPNAHGHTDAACSQQTGRWNLAWILFSISGRVGRLQFWAGYLCVIITYFLVNLSIGISSGMSVSTRVLASELPRVVWFFPASWTIYAVTTKRYHDRNKAGWWCLLYLIPVVGPLVVIGECGFLAGVPGRNKYDESGYLRQSQHVAARSFLLAAGVNTIVSVIAIGLTQLWLDRCPGCDDHIGEPGAGAFLGILLAIVLLVTAQVTGIVATVATKYWRASRTRLPALVGMLGTVPLLLVCLWLVAGSEFSDRDPSWTAAEVRVYVAADTDVLQVRYVNSPIACHTRRKSKGRSKLIDERGYIYVILDNGCSGYVTQGDLVSDD